MREPICTPIMIQEMSARRAPHYDAIDRGLLWLWEARHEIRTTLVWLVIVWPLFWLLLNLGD